MPVAGGWVFFLLVGRLVISMDDCPGTAYLRTRGVIDRMCSAVSYLSRFLAHYCTKYSRCNMESLYSPHVFRPSSWLYWVSPYCYYYCGPRFRFFPDAVHLKSYRHCPRVSMMLLEIRHIRYQYLEHRLPVFAQLAYFTYLIRIPLPRTPYFHMARDLL